MADPIGAFADGHDALLSALLDQSHECIQFLDGDGRILFVNREGARAMELSAPHDLIGASWIDRWPEEARGAAHDALQSVRRGTAARFSATRPGPHGEQRWWEVTATPIDGNHAAACLIIARDITAESIERQRVATISAEMRHRLRNAMTTAAGIVTIAARSHPECQSFARDINERLAMVAAVQDLLLDPARDKSFAEIVPLLTSAYGGAKVIRFGTLPDVLLGDGAMQALALTFGELATNSLKYGALKNGRSVEVNGAVEGDLLRLIWREPTVFGTPREGGQGLELIDRLIRASGGNVVRETDDGHFTLHLVLPCK
ncbi:PAS domain-containing protein [Sphingomonas sp. MMSM20]|uniref:PAS domain-containing protein n=1 Tax=Sphingomonas lycopersici TaxID=2951807 RepID=UPI00223749D9|nr:PAS domain-containing protein [Sphingomonas lycopersici]